MSSVVVRENAAVAEFMHFATSWNSAALALKPTRGMIERGDLDAGVAGDRKAVVQGTDGRPVILSGGRRRSR